VQNPKPKKQRAETEIGLIPPNKICISGLLPPLTDDWNPDPRLCKMLAFNGIKFRWVTEGRRK
jgi:hypothetical protein